MGCMRKLAGLLPLVLLAACVGTPTVEQPATPAPTQAATTAGGMALSAGPAYAASSFRAEDAAAALASFRESCPVLLRREDRSGLTRTSDWSAPCANAAAWPDSDAAGFFASQFEAVRVGDGNAFVTGYFEPQIAGSRDPRPGFEQPVYAMPPDLTRAWPADMPESERTGNPPLGRYDESGNFVPYFDRGEILDGALDSTAPIIAWAADPIEFFFLQIQGSGQLISPEGEVIRIGYAGQNGRGYTGIGALMRERGLIGDGTPYATSMQGIMQYLRAHPAEGDAIMRENQSWVFFRELTGDGPLGSIGIPVRGQSSVAVDPNYVPYGAPVVLDVDRPVANGLWIAQDTGGAIKGANRFDSFWGAGQQAGEIAGGMSARGQAVLLLPKGTLARHAAR